MKIFNFKSNLFSNFLKKNILIKNITRFFENIKNIRNFINIKKIIDNFKQFYELSGKNYGHSDKSPTCSPVSRILQLFFS